MRKKSDLDRDAQELALLEHIGAGGAASQRLLSERTGLSLGSTNIFLRRLIKKGAVKAKALNRRSVQYLLTPQGIAEKVHKAYAYTVRAIRAHQSIQARMQALVRREVAGGRREFAVVGDGELADLLELVLTGFNDEVLWSRTNAPPPPGTVALIVTPETPAGLTGRAINVMQELSTR